MFKPRLQKHYEERVRPTLMKEFGFDNPFRVPRLEKVVLNVGLDIGVISPALFAMMVLMALATTFMTSPMLARIYPTRLLRPPRHHPAEPEPRRVPAGP